MEGGIPDKNVIATAIETGKKLADCKVIPREKDQEETAILVPKGFDLMMVKNNLKRPLRRTGTEEFVSVKSFCSYVTKHKVDEETVIIAEEDSAKVKAVFNDNSGKDPGWKDFTAWLNLGFSKQWLNWVGQSASKGYVFEQSEFADFLEDHRPDFMVGKATGKDGVEIDNVSALELSDIINNLQMTSEQSFTSKRNPVSGEVELHYEDKDKGKGNVVIPPQFVLAIPVYRSGGLFQITIRLRHRMRDGKARFHYIIDQYEAIKEKAFSGICKSITNGNIGSEEDADKQFIGTGIEVLHGLV